MRRRHRLIGTMAAGVVVAATSLAAPVGADTIVGDGGAIEGTGTRPGTPPPPPGGGGATPRRPEPEPPRTFIVVPEVRVDPTTGQSCLHLGQEPGDPGSAEALANEIRAVQLAASYPPCPGSAAAPAVPSAAAVAAELWRDRMQLPAPQPRIQPGWAMAGRTAYLEVGGSSSITRTFDAFGYSIVITATAASNDVRWDDGAVTTGDGTGGGPWPHGTLTHVWQSGGTYDVEVTRRWTGRWALVGGAARAVPGTLWTTATIDDFTVRGVQAVRNR